MAPSWFRWFITGLVIMNILAYILCTWFAVKDIDDKIAKLEAKENSTKEEEGETKSTTKPGHEEPEINDASFIEVLEQRKPGIIFGAALEVLLDIIDLINVFLGNHCIHLTYAVLKMFSVGLWTFAQTALDIIQWWFIPIGIAMLITVVVLEYEEHHRKHALILLLSLSTLGWIAMLTVRLMQINQSITVAEAKIKSDESNAKEYRKLIDELQSERTTISIGTAYMLLVDLFGLGCVIMDSFCFCVTFENLHFLGTVVWFFKVFTSDEATITDEYFLMPLAYDVLIFCVLLLYLITLYNKDHRKVNKANNSGLPRSVSNRRRQSTSRRRSSKGLKKKSTRRRKSSHK